MSKILFTLALPHDSSSPNSSRTPQFFISCNNNTCLSMRGLDFKSARFGNSNVDPGWKNRFEYSVTASKTVTRFSLIVNTSVILPAMSWSSPYPKAKPPKQKKERGNSRSSSGSSRSSRSSKSSKKAKMNEEPAANEKLRERRRIEEDEDSRYSGRYSGRSSKSRKADRESRETDAHSNTQRKQGAEHEPRLRIQDRNDLPDQTRRVRWREGDRDDSSREGSDSRKQRIYDESDYQPRERRRKSRKVQDPGFADRMD